MIDSVYASLTFAQDFVALEMNLFFNLINVYTKFVNVIAPIGRQNTYICLQHGALHSATRARLADTWRTHIYSIIVWLQTKERVRQGKRC